MKTFTESIDILEETLEKAGPTKYIRRTPKKSGKGWDYEYADKPGAKQSKAKPDEKPGIKEKVHEGIKLFPEGSKREFTVKKASWGGGSQFKVIDKKTGIGIGSANTKKEALSVVNNFAKNKTDKEMDGILNAHIAKTLSGLEKKSDGSVDVQTSYIKSFFDVSPEQFKKTAQSLGYSIKDDPKNDTTILKKQ